MKWNDILPEEARRLAARLVKWAEEERVAGKQIFPPQDCIFQALEATPPDRVKAVIVGQDHITGQGRRMGWRSALARASLCHHPCETSSKSCMLIWGIPSRSPGT